MKKQNESAEQMSSVEKLIGVTGKIVNGKYSGWLIKIEDDSKNTGGYFILIWSEEKPEGYDNWVENIENIEKYFEESGMDILWPVH